MVSVMLASQCAHCAEWKKGLCCHQCTKETEVAELESYVQLSTINTTILVCLCCSAVIDCAPSPSAGSAMSGLDGLIGAEERIINSKPKISDKVVRAPLSLYHSVCASKHF